MIAAAILVCAAPQAEHIDGAFGAAETAATWWATQPVRAAPTAGVTGLDADLLDDDEADAADEAVPSERKVLNAARWLKRPPEEREPPEEDENTVWQDQPGFLW